MTLFLRLIFGLISLIIFFIVAIPAKALQLTGFVKTGIASTYGPGFDGRLTANGEIFDQYEARIQKIAGKKQPIYTAAHKSLPFNSLVRVTLIDSKFGKKKGNSVIVRINDSGPFIPGRIIDLNTAAANAIGMGNNIARVRLEVIRYGDGNTIRERRVGINR